MAAEFETGDQVENTYESTRSENVVSRTGTVVQAPEGNGRTVFFVEIDNNQLTSITSDYVVSITTSESGADTDDGSRVQRIASLVFVTSR